MVGIDGVSRSISDLDHVFAERYLLLKAAFYEKTGNRLMETCTYRTPKAQLADFNAGKTQTKLGFHNLTDGAWHPAAKAVDVGVLVGNPGKLSWEDSLYEPLRDLVGQFGLAWGGAWKHLHDADHIELASDLLPTPPDTHELPTT